MIKWVFLACFFYTQLSFAQDNIWATLGLVTFKTEYDSNFGIEIKKPTLSLAVKLLENKEIEVEGYFIPLNGKLEQNHFMLSKFNENMCFFCGKAGPETAMQVFLSNGKKQAYSKDKIKIKGILRINPNDSGGLLYTLDQAIVLN